MIGKSLIPVFIWIFLSPLPAQSRDCGNGMEWQFMISSAGVVSPERPILLYETVDGARTSRLDPSTPFTIVDGPTCGSEGRSWWLIEAEDGTSGWSLEGAEGDYYILPFDSIQQPTQVRNSEADCPSTLPPRLEVGFNARILVPEQFWLESDQFIPAPPSRMFQLSEGDEVLVIRGPACFEDRRLWQVRPPNQENIPDSGELWLVEAHPQQYLLEPTSTTLPVSQFKLPEFVLEAPVEENPAPIIDINMQIGYPGWGGGGPNGGEPNCPALLNWNTTAPGCIKQSFPENTSMVSVDIFRPDGTLYSNTDYDLTQPAQSDLSIRLDVPTKNGVNTVGGVWRIEYHFNSEIIERSYIVLPPLIEGRKILPVCDGATPLIQFYGYRPNEVINLSLYIQQESSSFIQTDKVGTWEMSIADDGTAQTLINFIVPNGEMAFFAVDDYFDWGEPTEHSFPYFTSCPSTSRIDEVQKQLVGLNKIIMSTIEEENPVYFAFEGHAGQSITINAASVEEADDLKLELLSSSGDIIAQNDAAEVPKYGPSDAAIVAFPLAETGIYLIAVRNNTPGDTDLPFVLIINEQ